MSKATELAEHIHDMFVSNWGFDSALAQDSAIVLATLRQQEAVIKQCAEALDSLYVNDYSGYEVSKHEAHKIDDALAAAKGVL